MQQSTVCVLGICHPGMVTSECPADPGCKVVGADGGASRVEALSRRYAPLYEPDLEELLAPDESEEGGDQNR